jgi:hypothetical protein
MQSKYKFKSDGKHTIPDLGIFGMTNAELTAPVAKRIIAAGLGQLLELIEPETEPIEVKKTRKKRIK